MCIKPANGKMEREKEEYGTVLDYLPNGYPFDTRPSHKKTAVIQAIGNEKFVLLELAPKKGIPSLQIGKIIYIGEGKRDEIHHIIGKLPMHRLTATAKSELKHVIEDLIGKNEKKFIDFFNNARPLSTRMHQLELLPGLGKKHMWEIINSREEKPFENFQDIKSRVKLLPDPKKSVIRRIMKELEGTEKHKIFVDI